MGFLDKAKKLADQAQQKLDEAQKQSNEGQAGQAGGAGPDTGQPAGPAVESAAPIETAQPRPDTGSANASPDPFKPIA